MQPADHLVDAWFPEADTAERMRTQLRDNPAAAGMCRVPLLATLVCLIASDPDDDRPDALHQLPSRRVELYERVLRRFLAAEHRPAGRTALSVDLGLEALGWLAAAFVTPDGGWTDRMDRADLIDALRSSGALYADLRTKGWAADDVLDVLTRDAGVLIPAGDPTKGRTVPFLFLHHADGSCSRVGSSVTTLNIGVPSSPAFQRQRSLVEVNAEGTSRPRAGGRSTTSGSYLYGVGLTVGSRLVVKE